MLSECHQAKYNTQKGKECYYYVCSVCGERVNVVCTNNKDHSCEKCEGLPHGRPFRVTPEFFKEAAEKVREAFRREEEMDKPVTQQQLSELTAWMKLQEEINKTAALELKDLKRAVKILSEHCLSISPLSPSYRREDVDWLDEFFNETE